MRDAFLHPAFRDGDCPGTCGSRGASNKLGDILLSPDLFERITPGGVFREGVARRPAAQV